MAKFSLSGSFPLLPSLPAVAVFLIVLFLHSDARSQLAPMEPLVLVSDDAEAFLAALGPELPALKPAIEADVVIVYPARPDRSHLVLVDIATGRKFWTVLSLSRLNAILSRIGKPA